MKKGYKPSQNINIRCWTEPGSKRPMQVHPDDLERGRVRRKTEDYLDKGELERESREIWE